MSTERDHIEDIDEEVGDLKEFCMVLAKHDRATQRRMLDYLVDRFITRPVRGDAPEERDEAGKETSG